MAIFFRLLASPIPAKGDDLRQKVAALNRGQMGKGVFQVEPNDITAVPGSPFAYWANEQVLEIFKHFHRLETEDFHVYSGTSTGDDFRFIRLFWEVNPQSIRNNNTWKNFPKGGTYSKFFSDPNLLINWTSNGSLVSERGFVRNSRVYFHVGLTYPPRTQKGLNFRILPAGCVFSHKGPAILSSQDDEIGLLALLTIINSVAFEFLVKMQMAFGSFEIGVIQNSPIPKYPVEVQEWLTTLSLKACSLARQTSLAEETTHVFCLPSLLNSPGGTLAERLPALAQAEHQRQSDLARLQAQIDRRVAELYGVPELAETSYPESSAEEGQSLEALGPEDESDEPDDEDELPAEEEIETGSALRPSSLVGDLLMWCVGAAFGRWDVRYALDPTRLPELPGPFDPLPVCSPGMLIGADGLPMRQEELPVDYPLQIAWDGFLADDPGHPRDITTAVERLLALTWPDKLEEIEREACQILGYPDLRSWLRDPKGFFAYHTRRYSKSRRKAPIYWPLQSAKRGYTIWLYYPRLNPGSLYHAGRDYADAKLSLETGRLADWQRSLATASGSARKVQERKIASQAALVEELKAFLKTLNAAALLEFRPDLNDGVLLNTAPLRELMPWKEAERAWGELLGGKYEWSSIGKQLREKGLVKITK